MQCKLLRNHHTRTAYLAFVLYMRFSLLCQDWHLDSHEFACGIPPLTSLGSKVVFKKITQGVPIVRLFCREMFAGFVGTPILPTTPLSEKCQNRMLLPSQPLHPRQFHQSSEERLSSQGTPLCSGSRWKKPPG